MKIHTRPAVASSTSRPVRLLLIYCLGSLLLAGLGRPAVGAVHLAAPEYNYYFPRMHEMGIRLPVRVDPGNKESFMPRSVEINGRRAPYRYFYFNNHTVDFSPVENASRGQINLYIPLHWRARETHSIKLKYILNEVEGEVTAAATAPDKGGAWADSTDNYAFIVREEAGFSRQSEPVEIDLTVEQERFPDPVNRIRATIMSRPGEFTEIPCQVYEVETLSQEKGMYSRTPVVRFRTALQVSLPARAQSLVHLWVCPPRPRTPAGIELVGVALGGTVKTNRYEIKLDDASGQILTWLDRTLGVLFELSPRFAGEGQLRVIHRTPDIYRANRDWSHALDWVQPESRAVTGPVMVLASHRGAMPRAPEAFGKVTYRFYAGRPEVRATSSLRINQDVEALGVRMGGLIQSVDLHTHFAWPQGDGSIRRISISDSLGNDMGAPPQARFPAHTPWVAFYHRDRKYGIALLNIRSAYFSDGPGEPNEARRHAYVSNYRDRFLYTIRAETQTYSAWFRSYHTPIAAGTTAYEEVAYLPFSFAREDQHQFAPVQRLLRELQNPLVIEP